MCNKFPSCPHRGKLIVPDQRGARFCIVGKKRISCPYLADCTGCTFKAEAVGPALVKKKRGKEPVIIRKGFEERNEAL